MKTESNLACVMSETGLLIIPGVQKSGTSSLWYMLLEHDLIHPIENPLGSCKEPKFFSLKKDIARSKIDWYKSLIGDESGWYVDASTSYIFSPKTLKIVESLAFPVKFLVILRDPAERSLSSYLHMHKKISAPERRSFMEIVDFIWTHRNEGIAEAENEGIQRAIHEGKIDPNYLQSHLRDLPVSEDTSLLRDSLWCYKYLQHSMYSRRLDNLEGKGDGLLVLSMKELISNTEQTANKIFDYLALDRQHVELPRANETRYTPLWWRRMKRYLGRMGVKRLFGGLEDGWSARLEDVLGLTATKNKAKARNMEALRRVRQLLDEEYIYWSQRKPSVLHK